MAFNVLLTIGVARRDELDRRQDSALMKELEHRMLRVGAGPAPGDWCRRVVDRATGGGHRFAVRFHLELLKIGWQKPQSFVVGKDPARLASVLLDVEPIGERG